MISSRFKNDGLLCALIALAVGLGILVSTVVVRSLRPKPRVVYHGPIPGTLLAEAASDSVMGKKTSIGSITPTPIVTVSPVHVQIPQTTKTNEYGIAAGGGLIYLGEKDLDQYFSSLQALGVQWVRWDFDWGSIQPNNSTGFDWSGTDRVVQTANKYGIKTLGIITYTPGWAQAAICKGSFACVPADSKMFGRFAGAVALRYKDSVKYWEIWNEPNYASSWKPKPDAKEYADILREAYTEIKNVNPQSFVLSGGLAAIGNEQDGSISPLTFMQTLYKLDANAYFDAVALHPYTYPALPSYLAWWNRWQQIVPIHQLMVNNNDTSKKIWITEYGAPTGGPGQSHEANQLNDFKYGVDFMTENAQRDLAIEATNFYRQYTNWMGPFFWYSLQDNGTSRDTPENFFGLLRYDGSKKPAYDVFRKAILSSQ